MKRLTGSIAKSTLLLLLASLFVILICTPVLSDELEASKKRLDQIQKQIEEALQGLRSKESQSGSLSEEISRLSAETRRIERLTKKSHKQLSVL
jgi:septal ring factor EnvC (AmiA/AmiB activator)